MFGFFKKRHKWVYLQTAFWYRLSIFRQCEITGVLQKKSSIAANKWKTINGKPVMRKHNGEWTMVRIEFY